MRRLFPSPIKTDEQFRDFYVDTGIQNKLFNQFKLVKPSTIIAIGGPMGSGKTTEARYAARRIEEEISTIKVIYHSILEYYKEMGTITIGELLLEIASLIVRWAKENKIEVSEDILKHVVELEESLTKEITREQIEEHRREAGLTGTIPLIIATIKGAIGRSKAERERIVEKMQANIGDLISLINKLLEEILSKKENIEKIIIVIDDTDKLPPPVSKNIFVENNNWLRRIKNCVTAYIITYDLIRGPWSSRVADIFDQVITIVPAIDYRTEKGKGLLTEILERRIPTELFEDEEIRDMLIGYSGGILRDMINLARNSCMRSIENRENKISRASVQFSKNEFKEKLKTTISSDEEYELIVKIHIEPNRFFVRNDTFRNLLHKKLLIEYILDDGNSDYRLHPVIEEFIKEGI